MRETPSKPPKKNAQTKYQFGVDHYAQLYAIPRATIIKYHRKNYPLDDPAELLKTIETQKAANKPPLTRLREIAKMHGEPAPKRPTPAPAPSPIELVPLPEFDQTLKGLQFEMARLKFETDEAYTSYRREADPLLKNAYWKTWKEMLDQWGKLAKLAPDAEREFGSLVKVSDIESTWTRTFSEVKTQLETLPRRLSTLPVFRKLDPVDVEQAVEGEAITIMRTLETGSWLKKETDEDS